MSSSLDSSFVDTASRWLRESEDLLIASFFGAGDRDYWFCKSLNDMEAFCDRTGDDYPAFSVCVFRGPRLPLRGAVDDAFIRTALAAIDENGESLVLALTPRRPGLLVGNLCENHQEVAQELQDCFGEPVAFGELQDWCAPDDRTPDERGWVDAVVRRAN